MNKLTRKNLLIGTAVLMALVMIISLFILRIGVSDNGAQYKLLEKLGLYDAYQTTGTGYYSDGFGIANKSFSMTSSGLIYDLAKQIFPVDGILYTAIPAILYMLMFIVSALLIVSSLYLEPFKGLSVMSALLTLFVFCDSAYIAYFNTPYKNASFVVYLIAMVAMFLYYVRKRSVWSLVLFALFACLFANTSTVAAITGCFIGLLSFRFILLSKKTVVKILTGFLSVSIILASVVSLPADVGDMYDSVFYGVALEDAQGVAKLGLDEKLNDYKEIPSFDEKAQEFINSENYESDFASKIGFAEISGYYLKNLPEFYKGMKKVAYNSTAVRTAYLSGFAPSSGKSGANTGFFTLYSTIKSKAMPASVIFFLLVLLALIYVCVTFRNNFAKSIGKKIVLEFAIVFALCTIITYPIPYFLSGMTQIGFNMFYFNAMFDLCLVMLVISGTALLMIKKKMLRDKYGVNQ